MENIKRLITTFKSRVGEVDKDGYKCTYHTIDTETGVEFWKWNKLKKDGSIGKINKYQIRDCGHGWTYSNK